MIINGTDYTFYAVVLASLLLLFGAQLFLCRRTKVPVLRHLPWLWVIAALGMSLASLLGDTGGFIDVRSFFALLFLGYAALCAASIGLAHLVNKFRK